MRYVALVGTLAVTACAGSAGLSSLTPVSPSASDIPALERLVALDSTDTAARIALGAAYRSAGRLLEARAQLERVVAEAQDPAATLYLALINEELHEYAAARALYQQYLTVSRGSGAAQEARRRIGLLERLELRAAARAAVANEQSLSELPPRPATVAILPLRYVGGDPEYQPLGRALAANLMTDLAQTNRLTVLERLEVQTILDELALVDRSVVDASTAAASGRLLRAEHIVQGSFNVTREQVDLSAIIVGVADSAARAPLDESDALARIFDLQERLALSIYAGLGIQLSAVERERVLQRPTENLRALLAYGRGLEAEDRGDYAEAAREYSEAARIDPGFTAAGEAATRADDLGVAVQAGVEQLTNIAVSELAVTVTSAGGSSSRRAVTARPTVPLGAVNPSPLADLDGVSVLLPDPLGRDPGAEVLGREGVATSTILRIIFRRP